MIIGVGIDNFSSSMLMENWRAHGKQQRRAEFGFESQLDDFW